MIELLDKDINVATINTQHLFKKLKKDQITVNICADCSVHSLGLLLHHGL